MKETLFVRANDIAEELDVSNACAYKIIRNLNNELKEKGFVTVQGRLSRQYFEERVYGTHRET
ncbi:MAG: LysR family transcriptional regulator [Eubacterium sp.]